MPFPTWTPPQNPSQSGSGASVQAKLLQTNFGDGYVQRVPDGINYIGAVQPLNWATITQAKWALIENFFLSVLGGAPFYWAMPGDPAGTKKWTCTSYKRGDWNGSYYLNCSTTLQQDFTPDPSP